MLVFNLQQFLIFRSVITKKQGVREKILLRTGKLMSEKELYNHDYFANLQEMANSKLPNLPLRYKQKYEIVPKKTTCGQYPNLEDLNLYQKYWQRFFSSNGTFLLFSAFYDNRELVKKKPTIRILGMINRFQPKVKTHCQMWFKNMPDAVISRVYDYQHAWFPNWYNKFTYKGSYEPYLMSCKVPRRYEHLVPESVSLVENRCDSAVTNLRVINNRSNVKKDFAVCVKSVVFPDASQAIKLIEWIEFIHHLSGNNTIFMYELQMHPTMKKIIDYYQRKGKTHVTSYALPRYFSDQESSVKDYLRANIQSKWYSEVIQYNDCFYRNMNGYKYIVLLDTDELIIPQGKLKLWKDTIPHMKKASGAKVQDAFLFQNAYFFNEVQKKVPKSLLRNIPKYLHIFTHLYRSRRHTMQHFFVKSFFNTETVFIAHNHTPLACLKFGRCKKFCAPLKYGQLQHYRKTCSSGVPKFICDKYFKRVTVIDDSILKYREPIVTRVICAIKETGIQIRT